VVWRISALQLMDNLNQANRAVVEAHVEKYCQSQGVKEVTAEVVFRSSPPEDKWLEVPKVAELECHAGPVTALQFSPFFRKILLSASTDGSVKVFDVLQARPIHVFCPPVPSLSQSALSGACWAPCRRLVFAVAAQASCDLIHQPHMMEGHTMVCVCCGLVCVFRGVVRGCMT